MQFPTIGIYKIVNKVTGKYYVGSSLDISRRWKDHVRDLTKNKHVNNYFQNAWKKYGPSSFEFSIVSILPNKTSEKNLLLEEQRWLDLAVNDPLTYNLTFVAGSPTANMSDYSKKKRSDALKKVIRTPEWKAKIAVSHIGIRPSLASRIKMRNSKLGKIQSKTHIENATDSRRKNWIFISPEQNVTKIYDLKRFCREQGLHAGNMYSVAGGQRSNHKGWKRSEEVA